MSKKDVTKAELEKQELRARIALLKTKTKKIQLDIYDSEEINKEQRCSSDEARVYLFYDSVEQRSVHRCIAQLAIWSRRSPGKDITLILNTPGGGVIDGLHLFDYIRQLEKEGHHITTIALGHAASMGGIILQAGSTRIMGKNAYLLIHEITSLGFGKTCEIEDELKFTKRLQGRLLDILAERSTLTKKQIADKWARKDWWLDSDEALKLGFCDEIN